MSKWLKLAATACGALVLFVGCGGGVTDKCKGVTCDSGKVCDATDGLCKTTTTTMDAGSGCNPQCSGATPVCKDNTTCVQCVNSNQCTGGTPICDIPTNTCKAITVVDAGTDAGTADAGPPVDAGPDSCAAGAVVNLNTAGTQDGLFLSVGGTLEGKGNRIEPPTGCQTDMGAGKGPEAVHTFTVPLKADVFFTTDNPGTRVDTVLYTLPACVLGTAPAGSLCNDDVDPSAQNFSSSILAAGVDAGTTMTLVVDSFNAASVGVGAAAAYQLGVLVRPIVQSGASCDKDELRNRCETGLVCSLASQCEASAAPTITSASYYNVSGTLRRVVIDGADTNGNTGGYEIEFLDGAGAPIPLQGTTLFSQTFSPTTMTLGKASFRAVETLNVGTTLAPAVSARLRLTDSTGLKSAPVTVAATAVPVLANNAACETNGGTGDCATSNYCKAASSGSNAGTCTSGTAPVLTTATAYYGAVNGDAGTAPRVAFQATDPEVDITGVVVQYVQNDGGFVLLGDGGSRTDTVGVTSLLGTAPIDGFANLSSALVTAAAGVTQLKVTLQDAVGLSSGSVTVPVNQIPVAAAGAACDIRRLNDICVSQTVCSGASPTCKTRPDAITAACAAATPLTLGTPITTSLVIGADLFTGACAGSTRGPEKIFSFTTTAVTDVVFTTDFPETKIDTVVYTSTACGAALTLTGCSDDIDFEADKLVSRGIARNLPIGTHYVFLDSWAYVAQAGTGAVKLLVSEIPVITVAGTTCDPLREANRCGGALRCKPNTTFSAYTCQ